MPADSALTRYTQALFRVAQESSLTSPPRPGAKVSVSLGLIDGQLVLTVKTMKWVKPEGMQRGMGMANIAARRRRSAEISTW